MDFDTLIQGVLRREGGAAMTNHAADRGGLTKYGISQRANPDVDVANLDEETAKRLYRERYWDAIGADSLDPAVRELAFDTAVQHGPGRAKQWLAEAKGDPQALLALRKAALQAQADEPGQEVFRRGWMNRIAEFEGIVGQAPVAPAASPTDAAGAMASAIDSIARGLVFADVQMPNLLAAEEQADAAERQARDDTGFMDALSTAWKDPEVNATWNLIDRMANKPVADPAFSYFGHARRAEWEAAAQNSTELAFIRDNATSEGAADWAVQQLKARRENARVYDLAGTASTFGAQALVSITDPIGWAAAVLGDKGASKAATLAGLTLRGASRAGVAVAGGAAGNVGWEAVQDAMGEVKTLGDYGMAAAVGALFTTPFLPSIIRQDAELRLRDDLEAELQRMGDDMLKRNADANVEVRRTGTSRDAQGAHEAEEIVLSTREEVDPANARDRIVPDDEAAVIRAEDEAPLEPQRPLARPEPAAPEAATTPEAPEAPEVRATLPRELAGAKPRYQNDVVEFESDLDKALYIVAQSSRRSKQDGAYMAWLREQFPGVSDADIRAEGALVRQRVKELPAGSRRLAAESDELNAPGGNRVTEALAGKNKQFTLRQAIADAMTSEASRQSKAIWPTLKYLRDRLSPEILDGTPVNFELGRTRAAYNRVDKAINLPYRQSAKDLQPAGGGKLNEAAALAHEAVHAATAGIIRAVRTGAKGVTMQQKQAVERLQEILDAAREAARKQGRLTAPDESSLGYALNSDENVRLDEFVAQVMSDHSTRSFLAQLPGRGYQADDMLSAFIRAILQVLGLTPKTAKGTALEEAMVNIDVLIRTGGDQADANPGVLYSPAPQVRAAADARFAARMYQHARDWIDRNPIDRTRLEALFQQVTGEGKLRDNLVSDGLKMAASKNPIIQMLAGQLVEVTTGAAGRRTTAAVHKKLLHQKIVGTSVVDYHAAYGEFRRRNGGGIVEDHLHGEIKRKFDRAVYEEILRRRYGEQAQVDPAVKAGADALEKGFGRSLQVQKQHGTLGSGWLPPDSVGYVPQQLDNARLGAATRAERAELEAHLAQHWEHAYGWSREFSQGFAQFYVKRARDRATGATSGVDFVAVESPTAAVRDTLEAMKLEWKPDDARARAELDRVGAMPSNKRRLDVDLLGTLPSGKRVMDYYRTDSETLFRGHANAVAGHSALAARNILGMRGVNNLLRAIEDAEPEDLAMPGEVAAVKRAFSEFLGVPVEGEVRSEILSGLGQLTRLQRLGGLAFTQLSETANIIHHLGLGVALKVLGSLPRAVRDVRKVAKGEKPQNAWLAPIERHQGFEFGSESFRLIAPLDPPDELLRQYGKGSSLATRLLSSGNYLQAKVSFFRGLHAAQHRAVAEHILKKAIGYIQDGNEATSRYLQDMGITPALARAIKADLPGALQLDASGNAVGFDVTKLSTEKAKDELTQAIHRGTAQIIQDTFIGERGAWAHNDFSKLILQLRTFGLTAMEKQWARTRAINSDGPLHGYGYAAGVLVSQMAFASMIFMARAQVYAAGREDREDFLEKAFTPANLVMAALNYSAMGGLMGDASDILATTLGGWDDDVKEGLGVRTFSTGVGSLVPAAGSIDAALRVTQGRGDLHTALKQLPGSNLPWLVPILNLAKEDE